MPCLVVPVLLSSWRAVSDVDEVQLVGEVEADLRCVRVVEHAVVLAEVGPVDALLHVERLVEVALGGLRDRVAVVPVPVVLSTKML